MPEKTDEEVAVWADQIVREHEYDQLKQLKVLFEAIKDKPVSMLIQLVGKQDGEQEVKSLLNFYLEQRKGTPKRFGR